MVFSRPPSPDSQDSTRSTSITEASPSVFQILTLNDSSDITLVIGEECSYEPIRVEAMKCALHLASPVWKSMFSPDRWLESSMKEVAFPDDDPEAMLLILRIAHLRFDELPKRKLGLQQLLNLAVVCNKYGLIKVVRPFLRDWVILPELSLHPNPDWLFVAWVFGYEKVFKAVADRLVTVLEVSEESETHAMLLRDPKPPGIVESILKRREDVINNTMDMFYSTVDAIFSNAKSYCTKYRNEACESVICGSLARECYRLKLLPNRLSGSHTTISIDELAKLMASIKISKLDKHSKCPTKVADLEEQVMEFTMNIPTAVLPEHLTHMEAQNLHLSLKDLGGMSSYLDG